MINRTPEYSGRCCTAGVHCTCTAWMYAFTCTHAITCKQAKLHIHINMYIRLHTSRVDLCMHQKSARRHACVERCMTPLQMHASNYTLDTCTYMHIYAHICTFYAHINAITRTYTCTYRYILLHSLDIYGQVLQTQKQCQCVGPEDTPKVVAMLHAGR